MCTVSNKRKHNSDRGYQGPEHTPLSWKVCCVVSGPTLIVQLSSLEAMWGTAAWEALTGLTFLYELLLGWALTLVFCQSYAAPMPIPGQAPCWSESWPWHMDLSSWLDLRLVSLPWTCLSISMFYWPCLLSPDLTRLPSSGTVVLVPVWGDTTLLALLSPLTPGFPSLVEHSALAAHWQGHLSCNSTVKKKKKGKNHSGVNMQ